MPVTININGLTLCHKGSMGISIATIPDVCKTPSPAGPIPLPYPNIAMSSDLVKGTTSVKGDGQMCAKYGSEFMRSTGDEPGTAGGILSSTFIREASWLTFSFDVKFEGKGACRLTDKMFHNHKNTVNAAGLLQQILVLIASDAKAGCEALVEYIETLIGEGRTGKKNGIRGLEERFKQQIEGGGHGAAGAPSAPFDRGANSQLGFDKGSNSWMRHNKEIEQQQKNLDKALEKHDDKCGGGPPPPSGAKEWASKPLPKPSQWKGPVPSASSASSGLGTQIAKGAAAGGAVILGAAAVVLFFVPFDGPVGEGAAGAGAVALWGFAFGT